MNLAFASKELDKIKGIELPEIDGVAGTIKNSGLFLKSKTIEFKDALIAITDDTGQIITNMLTLTWLYVGIFFIQVIALPLLMFWLLVKIINSLYNHLLRSPATSITSVSVPKYIHVSQFAFSIPTCFLF